MKACVLAGGVGSARLCVGLQRVVDPADLTIVVNTGDDARMRGLHVSADVDTVLYHLAGRTDWDRGWGRAGESFVANDTYRELAAAVGGEADLHEWFALGDRDLATHMLRTHLLAEGHPLSVATDAVRRALGVAAAVLPMSDDPVRTYVVTTSGERLDFQSYFVRRGHADEVASVTYEGADAASPAPGVVEAISGADVVVLPPSNPVLSVAPMLAIDGVRRALEDATAVRVAVSPIVGGRAIKGPADRVLASLGHEVSPVGVARFYEGLIDVFVLDAQDADDARAVADLGIRPVVCDTIMRGPDAAERLAGDVARAG